LFDRQCKNGHIDDVGTLKEMRNDKVYPDILIYNIQLNSCYKYRHLKDARTSSMSCCLKGDQGYLQAGGWV